ncbi:HNH endonuclease [uncultured virus]|nr:HNH endonuclease [uncultured virus]
MIDNWTSLSSLGFSRYEVHHTGIVRRVSNRRILEKKINKDKYIKLRLKADNDIYKNVKIDGLICRIFIGPSPTENHEVIHINGDTLDSNANNLRWGTYTEKIQIDKKEFRSVDYLNNITLLGEEWRDAGQYGYTDYFASSLGRIYSMRSGKILAGYLNSSGYMGVGIRVNDITKEVLVHILICYAFHGNPQDKTYTVDHIDKIKTNNIPNNLRWASKSEQSLNRDPFTAQKSLIAQIKDDRIIDFHTEESILEIFDVDQIIIPYKGIYHQGYLWISEKFTNLDMIDEIWKPLNINSLIIYVSNMGRVQTRDGKCFGTTLESGYKRVCINNHHHLVHKMIATAFYGNYDPKLVVNHKDHDRANNKLENLEIVTASDNALHSVESRIYITKAVKQLDPNGNIIAIYPGMREASEATKIDRSGIGKVANGKQKTAGGFYWKFL